MGAASLRDVCPTCRSPHQLATGSHAFHCAGCGNRWRRALCQHCGGLNQVRDEAPSWRCSSCRNFTRSWWKTPWGADAAAASLALTRRMAELRARRRRRFAAVVSLTAALLTGLTGVTVVEARAQRWASTVDSVCVGFERLMREEASGTIPRADLDTRLAHLDRVAGRATPDIRRATAALAASSARGSGDPAFQAAATELASACQEASTGGG